MNAANEKRLARLLLSLNHRLAPTVFLVCSNTGTQRSRLMEAITAGSPQYRHIAIDLSPHEVYSLRDAIARFVPDDVKSSKPLEYVVHFTGLSTSLWQTKDGKLEHTRLIDELNYERERLFHDYPFISFLWETPGFYKEIFFKAGDLMSWLVDRYEFEDGGEGGMLIEEVPDKEHLRHQGADTKRLVKIVRLEEDLHRLNESTAVQQKYFREKIDTLLSLGYECNQASQLDRAEGYLLQARKLTKLHYADTIKDGIANFYLGKLYTDRREFEKAISYFNKSWMISERSNDMTNAASIYHELGYAYQMQKAFEEALRYYFLALAWRIKTNANFNSGATYHQIGTIYEEQDKTDEALENFQLAIHERIKEGDLFELGYSYHHIGRVLQSLGRWKDALKYYKLSLEANKKSRNEYAFASDYHQIGVIHAIEKNFEEALRYFNLAADAADSNNDPNTTFFKNSIFVIRAMMNQSS